MVQAAERQGGHKFRQKGGKDDILYLRYRGERGGQRSGTAGARLPEGVTGRDLSEAKGGVTVTLGVTGDLKRV